MIFDDMTALLVSVIFLLLSFFANLILLSTSVHQRFFRTWTISLASLLITFIAMIIIVWMSPRLWLDRLDTVLYATSLFVHFILLIPTAYQIAGRTTPHPWMWIVFAFISSLITIWARYSSGLVSVRVFLNVVHAAIFLAFSVILIRNCSIKNQPHSVRIALWFVSLVFLIYALVRIGMSIISLFETPQELSDPSSTVNLISILLVPPCFMLMNIAMIVLVVTKESRRSEVFTSQYYFSENEAVIAGILAELNHEMNTPLSIATLSASHLLEKNDHDDECRDLVRTLNGSLETVTSIIRDRNEILDRNETIHTARTSEIVILFNRILDRGMPSRRVVLDDVGPDIIVRTPYRCPFTFMITYISLIRTYCEAGNDTLTMRFSLGVDPEEEVPLMLALAHNGRRIPELTSGPIDSRTAEYGRHWPENALGARLQWLAEYVMSANSGYFTIGPGRSGGEEIVLHYKTGEASDSAVR